MKYLKDEKATNYTEITSPPTKQIPHELERQAKELEELRERFHKLEHMLLPILAPPIEKVQDNSVEKQLTPLADEIRRRTDLISETCEFVKFLIARIEL